MPPHGRRRASDLLSWLALLFVFASTASAASAVLGIDLGTEYIKAALVKPGIPLEIVLTKDSKRKEAAAVAFKSLKSKSSSLSSDTKAFPERIYSGDALALTARFSSDVYPNLKPLLGQQFQGNAVVSEYGKRYPGLKMVESKDRSTVAFKSESFDTGEEPFLVEELLAMELKNIRKNAQALAGKGSSIQDVVITIPPFYTAEEKRAVALAADLAGLRLLSLVSDGLSVGLNYATSRSFPTVKEGKPEIHLVYDMGAGSASATVLKFQGKTVKDVGRFNKTVQEVQILGTGWDRTLGGDALNQVVMEDMVQKFLDTTRMKALGVESKHIKEHGRTMAKLWKEAEKIRQVLSANTETSASFEALYYEDVKFKYKLTRSEFEELVSAYANRVQKPITDALESAKLSIADVESVILHGGAVRTPFVQKQLEAAIGDSEKIRTNVNSDEAAVFGAAFKAAGISPSFRVKEIRAADNAGYAVGASWTSDGKERQQKLFVPTSTSGIEKQVSFKVTEDFSFSLYEQIARASGDFIVNPVSSIKTENLTSSVKELTDKFGCSAADISTKFAIRVSPTDGLPEVLKGSVSCEVADKKGGMVDGVKDFLGFGSKKGDQEPLQEDGDAEPSTSASQGESSTVSSSKESKTPDSSPENGAKTDEKAKDAKQRTEIIYLSFFEEPAGLPQISPETLQRIKDRLDAFDASDRLRVKREETLNTLESFTYRARDLLEDEEFIAASTATQRTEIEGKFKSASEWLYGDGADASMEVLKERLDGLRGLVGPIQKRKEESRKRPQEVKMLQEALNQTKAMVSMVSQHREAMSVAEAASSAAASESESQTTAPPSSSTDEFADLDDETTSSTTTSAVPDTPEPPLYTAEDLDSLTTTQESVQTWLDAKLAEQSHLSPHDDPVLLSSDLAAKSKQLNEVVMQLLQKQMRVPPPKPKSAGKPKTSKAKKAAKTTKSTTKTASESAAQKAKESATVPEGGMEDMPGAREVTDEEVKEAMAAQKAKAREVKEEKEKKKKKSETTAGKGKEEPTTGGHGEL